MRRLSLSLVVVALTAAACGSAPGTEPTGPVVADLPDPTAPEADQTMIGCPSGPWFPRSSLETQTDLDSSGRHEIAEAIRPFLDSEEGVYWPQEGWRILHSTPESVLLVHLDGADGLSFMTIEKTGDSWNWAGAQSGGSCPLVIQMPQGLNTVEWRVDPDEKLSPDSTSIRLTINERECVSGQEIGDRLIGPEVVYTDSQILVSFAAEPPPGDAFNCQGNPETPYVLDLVEPLGDRELVDGRDTGIKLEDVLR